MKKAFLSLLLAVLLVPAAAVSADFIPALDPDTEGQLIVAGSYNNFEALEAIFDEFAEYYPEIDTEFRKLDNYASTIIVALEGDEAPDIFTMQDWMVGREEYDELFDTAENLADPELSIDLSIIRPGLLVTFDDGSVPMIPIFTSSHGMLVNEDIFKKEGLEIPTTLSELLDVCEKLKAAGYPSPIMGSNVSYQLFNSLTSADIYSRVKDNPEAVEKMNHLEESAGEYLRSTLEFMKELMDRGFIDLEYCSSITDDYQSVILRFFEGDVPMMVATGDIASGTEKRQSLSENFTNNPFTYSMHLIPSRNDGLFFLNSDSLDFAVNGNSANLEITNEFMRFLVQTETLNEMARIKRLITPTNDFGLDGIYASLGEADTEHTVYPQAVGLLDVALIQNRGAAMAVGRGEMSIDEAIAAYGTF